MVVSMSVAMPPSGTPSNSLLTLPTPPETLRLNDASAGSVTVALPAPRLTVTSLLGRSIVRLPAPWLTSNVVPGGTSSSRSAVAASSPWLTSSRPLIDSVTSVPVWVKVMVMSSSWASASAALSRRLWRVRLAVIRSASPSRMVTLPAKWSTTSVGTPGTMTLWVSWLSAVTSPDNASRVVQPARPTMSKATSNKRIRDMTDLPSLYRAARLSGAAPASG